MIEATGGVLARRMPTRFAVLKRIGKRFSSSYTPDEEIKEYNVEFGKITLPYANKYGL